MQPGGPHVIGGTGGSGTRVVARIARLAGLYTGSDLNDSEDALAFAAYLDRWIDRYAAHGRAGPPPDLADAMRSDLRAVVERHLAGRDAASRRWGWKEPRSIFLLPFLDAELPGLRFVHVVRDGRDLAFSENQNQPRKHGAAVLGRAWDAASEPARAVALWRRVNLEAAAYAERALADRYLLVRFEDLCARPLDVVPGLLAFLGLAGDAGELAGEVQPPPTLGRWRSQPPELVARLERIAADALGRFGYA